MPQTHLTLGRRLRQWVERLTNTQIYRALPRGANAHIYRVLPRGIEVSSDIAIAFPGYKVQTVFDVGANVGQSAEHYVSCFPDSRIYCFEPVTSTFEQLQRNVKHHSSIQCFQLALGADRGRGRMALDGRSARFFLLKSAEESARPGVQTESVETATLDDFCSANGVGHVNYLKIDTEGADLDVLKGAEYMLTEQRIDFVEVEAGMNAGNCRHVPFEVLKTHLESKGYLLFGIYAQMHEWPTKQPHLRRTNITFVSRTCAGAATSPRTASLRESRR